MPFKDPERRKQYQKKYHAEWYEANKDQRKAEVKSRKEQIRSWFYEYKKTLSCSICGLSGQDYPRALDFDHRPNEKKDMIVSKLVGDGYGMARILKEISKCDVLCANCHRRITHDRQEANRSN